jgi:hypothetical protein
MGLQLTHHWGFMICSTTSPDREQIGICISLSLASIYKPFSLSALMISFLMWNRFIPYKSVSVLDAELATDLVFSGVLVVCTVIVHEVDEFEVVSLTTLEIVRVVGWGNLDSTSTKRHVDSNGISDDGDSTAIEWVNDEFAVEVSVSRIIGVNGNGGIS